MREAFQTVVMPNGSALPFNECIDNLQHTRDYSLYLDTLLAISKNYLIIASVNDNYGRNIPDDILRKLHKLGFKKLKKNGSQRYICVIERGKVFCEISEEIPLKEAFFESEFDGVRISIASKNRKLNETDKIKIFGRAFYMPRNEAYSEIKINGKDYSLNCSGLNIVIYDINMEEIVDSSTYDFALAKPTFFHKNFIFDDEYFDTHFFLKPKYDDIWRGIYRKSYYSNKKLRVKEVENGIFLPVKRFEKSQSDNKYYGGVCDENFNFIAGCEKFIHDNFYGFTKHICGSYTVLENDLEYMDDEVIYGGWFFDHPGHLICECFSLTIWYAALLSNSDVKIAVKVDPIDSCYPESQMGKYYFSKQFFSAMGIPEERIIFIEKPTKFKKIIIPDQSYHLYDGAFTPYSFSKEYILPYKAMRERAKPVGFSKVYFTKSKSAFSNFMGEDYFIDFYKKKGFKIIDPEDYTIAEKAGILREADEFVTFNGTSQHYTVFCKPSIKVTILQRDNASLLPVQTLMTEAAGINSIYIVDVSLDFLHQELYGNINLVGVTDEWARYVKEVYGEKLNITKEEYIRSHMYEYLCFYPKYYFQRQDIYDGIKNFKALDMLKNISEVLLGEELDTNALDLTTQEEILREKCEKNNSDLIFAETLFHDIFFDNRLSKFLCIKNCKCISLLCNSKHITNILKDVFAKLNIELICICDVVICKDVPETEWEICKKADLILRYCPQKLQFDERDGIKITDICDIILAYQ